MGRGELHGGMVHEVGADQTAIPGPVVLGVGGRVDADEPVSRADVAFQRLFFAGAEDVPGRIEKHDDVEVVEACVEED